MNSLERLLIGPSATLHDAMVAVDAGGIRIVIVVDEARQVLGTLTDGDIRRALLRQLSMDTLCSEIMTRSPETASVHASKDEILKRMESRRLIQMPLVDDYGRIAGVQTLHDLIYPQRKNNIVFLMAGGFGTRLQPLTDNCPKPLLNVGDKPILEIIIQNFVNAGFYRFYISTHYRPEMIREKIFIHCQKEVPYSSQIEIEEYLEEQKEIIITSQDYTEAELNINTYETDLKFIPIYIANQYIKLNSDQPFVLFNGCGLNELTGGYTHFKNYTNENKFDQECKRLLNCIHLNLPNLKIPFLDRSLIQTYLSILPEIRSHVFNNQADKFLIRATFEFIDKTILPIDILTRPHELFKED